MSVSNLVVKQDYTCNGVTDTFAIPFSYLRPSQVQVYLFDTTTNEGIILGLVTDYNFDPPYDAMDPNLEYISVVTNDPPPTGKILRIERETPLVQDGAYRNNQQLLLEELDKSFDKLTYMIQELDFRLDNVPILHQLDQGILTVTLPRAEPGKVLAVHPSAPMLYWVDIAELSSEQGNGFPTGGDAGDVLTKTGPNFEDKAWTSYAFDGFSALTGAQFTSADLMETLEKIIRITYTPPTISLTAAGSTTIREKGTNVTSVLLTASVVKKSDPIAEVRFYRGGTLLDTQTSGGAVPNGGNSTYTYNTTFSDDASFGAIVEDNGATGGPTEVVDTKNFVFVYPYFVGAGAAGASAATIAAMTKLLIVSTATVNRTITATTGQHFYFAYPAAYPDLTSILDVNGFETLPDWTKTTKSFTALDASSQSYKVYEFNNPVVAGDYYYSFRR